MPNYDICVFGGASWDSTYINDLSSTVVHEGCGSKGANQAVAASRAGAKVVLISKVGNDLEGKKILQSLKKDNVEVSHIETLKNVSSDKSVNIISNGGKNKIIRHRGAIDHFSIDDIEKNKKILLNSSIIVLQFKIDKRLSSALIDFCVKNQKYVVLTPCRPEKINIFDKNDLNMLNSINLITANKTEALQITKTKSILEAIERLKNMIVTDGENGVYFFQNNKIEHINSLKPKKLVDTTGAGDCFNGYLTASLVRNIPLKDSIKIAIKAATIKLNSFGAQNAMPYIDDLIY